jgi:hypothetical protein
MFNNVPKQIVNERKYQNKRTEHVIAPAALI